MDRAWQPSDFVPESFGDDDDGFLEEVREMRQVARGLPDELLVVLIGDMITEEVRGLPTTCWTPNPPAARDASLANFAHRVGSANLPDVAQHTGRDKRSNG